MDSSHNSQESKVLFVKIGARVLYLWLDMSSWPRWPKCSFKAPGPKVKTFFQIWWFYWTHLMILEKVRSWLWKLELWFSTTGLISHLPKALGPNCLKLSFLTLDPKCQNFGIWKFFHVKLHKILHQLSSYFQILGQF